MNALITGGAGFIGSNLARRLLEEGWQVTIVDDLSGPGHARFAPIEAKLILGDMINGIMPELIRSIDYDVVFHLAANPSVGYSVEHPGLTTDVNLLRTVKLFEACRTRVGRIVYASSSAIYGNIEMFPTPVWARENPQSPYAMQKWQSEQYAKMFRFLYGMDIVSFRLFNVFGPNQLGKTPYSCAIASWLHAVKNGQPFRSDGDGTQSRDLIYVDDAVDLFLRCAKHPHKFHAGEVFNGGTGKKFTNNEILDWFRNKFPNVQVVNAPSRPGDVKHTQADMSKTERVLGWKETVPFLEGLDRTCEWAMSNPLF